MALNFDFKSMDKKKLGIIAIAVVAGLVAVVLTNNYIEQTSRDKASKMAGGLTTRETQELMQRIQQLEQANQQLASQQSMLAQAQQQAAETQAQQQQQQPPPRPQQSLAVKTPIGKRAYTVMIEKLSAVGGMIAPGDYVDIIIHLNIPAEMRSTGESDATTVTMFQDILVLAVADSMQPGVPASPEAQTATSFPVTFALDPREAGLLSFAQKNGTVQLQLRPPLDKDSYLLPVATWNTLSQFIASTQGGDLGVKAPRRVLEPEPVAEPKPKIEIFRGGQ